MPGSILPMKTSFILLLTGLACTAPAQTPRLVVQIGHTNLIASVAFSPDGKTVLPGLAEQVTGMIG